MVGYGFDAQATDRQKQIENLKVRSTTELDLNSSHLARELSPIPVPKSAPSARGKIYIFTVCGVFQAADLATLRFQFGTPGQQQELVFGNVQIPAIEKVPGIEQPLDRQNARAVVEAFVAAAIAGRIDEAASLVDQTEILAEDRPASRHAMAEFFRQLNVQQLAMKSVYVNDPAKPTTALAISESVKLARKQPDGQRDSFLVVTLTMSEGGWLLSDEELESEESADRELKKYLEANPISISVPPQAASETATSPADTTSAIPTRVKYFTAGDGKKIACSPDGKLIAVANGGKALPVAEGWKRTVEILDAETGKTAVSIPLTTQEEDALLAATEGPRDFEVGALAFSPDGRLLAVGTTLGQVKLFESRTGKLVLSLDDEAARLADQKTPEKLKSLKRAMGSVGSLAFSPDGLLMATSGLSFEDAAPNWGGVHELGRLATGPGRLKVWGVQSGELRNDLVGHSHANAVAFSPNGTYLASVGSWQGGGGSDHDGSGVILWAPNTGIKLRTFPVNTNGGTWSVAFSPKGKLMAISSRTFDQDNDTSTSSISLLRTATGILEWKQTVSGWGHPVAFTPDGKSAGVLSGGEAIRFFDTETGTLKHHLGLADPSQGARWNDFALLSQGRLAIAGVDNSRQGKVEIWDFTGRNVKVSAIEKSLDRQNARLVVEAFVAAAALKQRENEPAAALEKNAPADPTQVQPFRRQLNLQGLAMRLVYVNDPAKPMTALAISEAMKPTEKGRKDIFLVLKLTMSEEGWLVPDIGVESKESAERELKKFLEANPKSIDLPPQREAQARAAHSNPVVGHWKVVKLADIPVAKSQLIWPV